MANPGYTVIKTIPVGDTPYGMLFLDGHLYVTTLGDNHVAVIDTSTNTVLRRRPVGEFPVRMTLADFGDIIDVPDTPASGGVPDQKIYVANTSGSVSVIRPIFFDTVEKTFTLVNNGITDVATTHRDHRLLVTDVTTNSVLTLDTRTDTVINGVVVGDYPAHIVVSADGNRAYVTNAGAATISVIDNSTVLPKVIDTISVGDPIWGLALSADGRYLYGTQPNGLFDGAIGHLAAIDLTTKLITTIQLGATPFFVALNKAGTRAFVSNVAGDTVSEVNITNFSALSVASTISVPNPGDLQESPDGKHLYVSNVNPGTVSVIGRLDIAGAGGIGG
jgi:YVTN family beta-propeller protein